MILQKTKPVYPAIERIAAGLQEVKRSSTFRWDSRVMEGGTRRLIHGLVKQT